MIIIFRKPEQIVVSGQDQILKDSISILQRDIDSSIMRQNKIQKAYDSILNIEPIIINKTHDKVHFIFSNATPDDLDSIIRANWKTKSRYR